MSSNGYSSSFVLQDVYIKSVGTSAGLKEKDGPLGGYFDHVHDDHYIGQTSYELAEMTMLKEAIETSHKKAKLKQEDISIYIGGDLNNQITASNYVMKEIPYPFYGIYSACSTIGQAIQIGGLLLHHEQIQTINVFVSSHNAVAERQFRYPNEYGIQKKNTSTFTATGGVSVVLDKVKQPIRVESITIGKIVDLQQSNPNDMGRAMAPAAFDTLKQHLKDLNRDATYYDLIVTGDLSTYGKAIMEQLMMEECISFKEYNDCGCLLYNEGQEVDQGGSGPTCSGLVTFGYLYKMMLQGRYKRILVLPTGALLSPVMTNQKQTIPCISHAFSLEVE